MKRKKHIARLFYKNRMWLMHMVTMWLIMGKWFARKPSRVLPRRLSAFVDKTLCKAELATLYLRVVAGEISRDECPTLEEMASAAPLTIGRVITRLKAVLRDLRRLRLTSKTRLSATPKPAKSFDRFLRKNIYLRFLARAFAPP